MNQPHMLIASSGKDIPELSRGCPASVIRAYVPGDGPLTTEYAIVGEGPGRLERIRRKPFVGPSGDFLWNAVEQARMPKEQVYVTNVEKCYIPQEEKPKQLDTACTICSRTLIKELQDRRVKYVLALGNEALNALTETRGITKARGQVIERHGFKIMPTIHPAAILRMPSGTSTKALRDFEEDVSCWANRCSQKETNPIFKDYRVIDKVSQAVEFLYGLRDNPYVVVDIETTGFDLDDDTILCIGFSCGPYDATILTDDVIYKDEVIEAMQALSKHDICWIGHNLNFELVRLEWMLNVRWKAGFDTMLAHYAFDETPGIHDLKSIAQRYLEAPNWEADIKQYLPTSGTSFGFIPRPVLYRYNAQDLIYTFRLFEMLKEWMSQYVNSRIKNLFDTVLMPGVRLVTDMTLNGLCIDMDAFESMRIRSEASIAEKIIILQELARDTDYNPNSSVQTAKVLYETLGAPPYSKSGTGRAQMISQSGGLQPEHTTNKAQLERLSYWDSMPEMQRFVKTLIDYRQSQHLLSNYIAHFVPLRDGRIHPNYSLHRSVTGRLASSEPNVMNMSHAGGVRGVVVPELGNVLICADYSQMELRVAAMMSGDEVFRQVYRDGRDIHDDVSKWFYGNNYSKIQRVIAKSFVFGKLYGRGEYSISQSFGISIEEAREKMTLLESLMPRFAAWCTEQHERAISQGFVESPLGRRRRFPVITEQTLHAIKRYAVNAPIQGTASDIQLMAMIEINKWIGDYEGKVLMPLHDSGNYEVPEDLKEKVAELIRNEMVDAPRRVFGQGCIPFTVDIEYGYSLEEASLITVDQEEADYAT